MAATVVDGIHVSSSKTRRFFGIGTIISIVLGIFLALADYSNRGLLALADLYSLQLLLLHCATRYY